MHVDLEALRFEHGGKLLVKRALCLAGDGETVTVAGGAPDLAAHLRAWCRAEGHECQWVGGQGVGVSVISRGPAATERWSGVERAGGATLVHDQPAQRWGLAGRSALVESGAPEFHFALVDKVEVWSRDAAHMYAQAAAAQWDPATAIPWDAPCDLPPEVEDAVVQIMTYLIENETAALIVPSRFIAQMHPHFREVMQVLAIQAADEARHIEVFTRRALLKRAQLGLSTSAGQASLQTLVMEARFAIASFLLSVLGEGTFLTLLWFIERFAPDPITAAVCRRAAQDEARHVAFGMSHIRDHMLAQPGLRDSLINAVRQRHEALQHTAGLNSEVFDALVLVAAGSWAHADLARGSGQVSTLIHDMHITRQKRLIQIGFTDAEAEEISSLHTRNLM